MYKEFNRIISCQGEVSFSDFSEVIFVFHVQNIKDKDEFRSICFARFLEAELQILGQKV